MVLKSSFNGINSKTSSRRSYLKASGALAAGAALSGCIGGGGGTADELTFYGPASLPNVIDAFEEETGITVNEVTAPGAQSLSRFQSETDQGEHNADVIYHLWRHLSNPDIIENLEEVEIFSENEDRYEPGVASFIRDNVDDNVISRTVPFSSSIFLYGYSTDRVEEAPTTWEDAIDPQFEGKIVTPSYVGEAIYFILEQRWSVEEVEDYLMEFDSLNPEYQATGMVEMVDGVIGGQYDLAFMVFGGGGVVPRVNEGAPVGIAAPEFTGRSLIPLAMSANAPNPDAAREFLEFSVSEPGQQARHNGGYDSLMDGIDHGSDDVQQLLDEKEVFPFVVPFERRTEILERFEELGIYSGA